MVQKGYKSSGRLNIELKMLHVWKKWRNTWAEAELDEKSWSLIGATQDWRPLFSHFSCSGWISSMLLMCGFFSFFLLPLLVVWLYYCTSNSVKPTCTFTHMCMDLCLRNLRVMPICNNIVLFTFFSIEQSHTHILS